MECEQRGCNDSSLMPRTWAPFLLSWNRPFRVSSNSFLMYAFWRSRNDQPFYSCQHCCAIVIFKIFFFFFSIFSTVRNKMIHDFQWSRLYLAFIFGGLLISLRFIFFLLIFYWRREICVKTQINVTFHTLSILTEYVSWQLHLKNIIEWGIGWWFSQVHLLLGAGLYHWGKSAPDDTAVKWFFCRLCRSGAWIK